MIAHNLCESHIMRLFITPFRLKGVLLLCILPFYIMPLHAEIKINEMAPGITLRDVENKLVLCKNVLKKKPILVSFFFTGCRPCKKEIPELEKLNGKYKNRVQFYLIAIDKNGADDVKPYIEAMKITLPVLLDPYQDAVQAFGVTKYPTLYIIGCDGRVRYACFGYDPKNIDRIEAMIRTGL
jgi:thiol-disulfide isomerase/thioredoxin